VRPPPRFALAVLVLGVALGAPAQALAASDVYRPKHRLAEELVPLAEVAMAGRGSVAVDRMSNSIVLVGDAQAVADARALLERQDVALPSIVLHYAERRSADLEAEGFQVRWSLGSGGLRVGNVVRPDGEEGVAVRPIGRDEVVAGERRGTLRLLPGKTGQIGGGVQVPVTLGRPGYESTTYVDAQSGFRVTPRVLGDGRVRLELEPFGGRLRPDGSIETLSASTVVDVAPGETVVVGGLARESDRVRRDVGSGAVRGRGRDERVLLVRIEVD
jgi:hypothetical protein